MILVMDEDQLLTHAQAAHELGVSLSHLYTLRISTRLPSGKLALTVLKNESGAVRYRRSEIRALRELRGEFRPARDAIPA